jgi:protein ImuB
VTESAAPRLACVHLPALPLQLLVRDHPTWADRPIAVVEDDRPQARLSWINEHARRLRILPGMRYAAARSLASDLRAAVVPARRIDEAIGDVFALLHAYSPRVEPGRDGDGSFWLDPGGLARLYGSHEQWAHTIARRLEAEGWTNTLVVGFHRFRVQAIAHVEKGCVIVPDPAREARMAAAVPLARLSVSAPLRDELQRLGIGTLGQFMALPAAELRMRFGDEAHRLRLAADDDAHVPLQPRALVDPIETSCAFDPPEGEHARLLFRLKPLLGTLMQRLAERSMALTAIRVGLDLDHAGSHVEQIEGAPPPPPQKPKKKQKKQTQRARSST